MIYLVSCLDSESLRGLYDVELKPTDNVWVLPVCCMECDVPDYIGWEKVFGDTTNQRRKNIDELLERLGVLKENIHYFNYYEKKLRMKLKKATVWYFPVGLWN